MPVILALKGRGADLEVYDSHLKITPQGFLGGLSQLTERRTTVNIQFSDIEAIEFSEGRLFISGFLQIIPRGSKEKRGTWFSNASNHNAVLFDVSENKSAAAVRQYLESRIAQIQSANFNEHMTRAPSSVGVTDELAKLAALHRSGVLTDDEFRLAKQNLLKGPT